MGTLVFLLALGAFAPFAFFLVWVAYKIGGGKRSFMDYARRF